MESYSNPFADKCAKSFCAVFLSSGLFFMNLLAKFKTISSFSGRLSKISFIITSLIPFDFNSNSISLFPFFLYKT